MPVHVRSIRLPISVKPFEARKKKFEALRTYLGSKMPWRATRITEYQQVKPMWEWINAEVRTLDKAIQTIKDQKVRLS